jgi:hypothetical protein
MLVGRVGPENAREMRTSYGTLLQGKKGDDPLSTWGNPKEIAIAPQAEPTQEFESDPVSSPIRVPTGADTPLVSRSGGAHQATAGAGRGNASMLFPPLRADADWHSHAEPMSDSSTERNPPFLLRHRWILAVSRQ